MVWDLQQAEKLIAQLQDQVEQLRADNRQLRDRIAELERAQARQAAPFRRESKKKVPQSKKKKPGRKPGHPGARRQVPKAIDHEVEVPLPCCPDCGGQIQDRFPLVQWIEEIPPQRPVVTRLVTWTGTCRACGDVRSTHPLQTSTAQGAASVQLGPRALAVAAQLNKQMGLTMRNTCRVFERLFGLSITPGGLSQALDRTADKVQSRYNALHETIRTSKAVYADETSWWVGGPKWWLWTFTTPEATLYRVEPNRNQSVIHETLGENFSGILVSDCLNIYDAIDCRKHKCFAHHHRAIAAARDGPATEDEDYLQHWKRLLQAASALWKARPLISAKAFAQERARVERRRDQLLYQKVKQPGDESVQNRLLRQRDHLLGCLSDPAAEPTNNRAERALRPAVIARKLSCGNRTLRGRRTWEILTSLAQTCHQNAEDFLDWLPPKLTLATQAG